MSKITFECQVMAKKDLGNNLVELSFNTNAPFLFKAGQTVGIQLPLEGSSGSSKAQGPELFYSVASSPEQRPIVLLMKLVPGRIGADYINSLLPGASFHMTGPVGSLCYQPTPKHVCFIATGTGIAPFKSIICSRVFEKSPPRKITLLLGNKKKSALHFEEQIRLARPNINWIDCLSDPEPSYSGFRGKVTDYLNSCDDSSHSEFDWNETEFYLCGQPQMVAEAKALLLERGVSEDSIHHESMELPSELPKIPKTRFQPFPEEFLHSGRPSLTQ